MEMDTQLKVSKHHPKFGCRKPYSLKIGRTVRGKIGKVYPTIWSRKVKIN